MGITAFDRVLFPLLNGSDSAIIDHIMLDLTTWWVWLPLYIALIVLIISNNENNRKILMPVLSALLCFACTEVLTDVVAKPIFCRPRPFETDIMVRLVDGYRHSGYSFFSAHAANTMGLCVFISLLVKDRIMTFVMLSYALLTSVSRIYLGQHFPTDVIMGIVVGAVVATLVYHLYQRMSRGSRGGNRFVSEELSTSGYSHKEVEHVASLSVVIYVLIIIHSVIIS